jgi:hypothetical protein
MPKIVTIAQTVAYLRVLAETGNATLAAEHAGVSRAWAYKKREVDAGFGVLCGAMMRRFREAPHLGGVSSPPLPARADARVALSREGRGAGRRTRVNRDRVGGWTAAKEAAFLERLEETCSVPFAAAAVGLSAHSAYQRRRRWPVFAAAWDEAERAGWPPLDQPWIESAVCFFEGCAAPPDNPVRIASVRDVLQALKRGKFQARPPRAIRPKG